MIKKQNKTEVINKYKKNDKDTGSAEVQVALLTKDIERLTEHFKAFPKDYHSKTGLMKMVGRRKRFLDYLKKHDEPQYKRLLSELEIRG